MNRTPQSKRPSPSKARIALKSPLRYPGGKTRAVETLLTYLPARTTKICAPFFGGGSFELACLDRGIEVVGYDVFDPLVAFWQMAVKKPQALAQKVQAYYPLSRTRFYELQKSQMAVKDPLEKAAVFFVLNRSSFSGSTLSGGMSPAHPRFTPSAIERLRSFHASKLTVKKADFKRSIPKHEDDLLYLDPPYLIANTLYGVKGDTHRDFDHEGLRDLLVARGRWILSYNNCSEILYLYRGYPVVFPEWKYGMSNDKSSKEVLIFSKDLSRHLQRVLAQRSAP